MVANTKTSPSSARHFDAAQLAVFAELSPDLFCVIQPNGLLEQVNPAFYKVLGYDSDAIDALSVFGLIHPEDRAEAITGLLSSSGTDQKDIECRVTSKDGAYLGARWRASYLPDTRRIVACARVLDAEKTIVQEIPASSFILNREAADRTSDPILWIGKTGRIVYVNVAACEILGYNAGELLNMSVADCLVGDAIDNWDGIFGDRSTSPITSLEASCRHKDRKTFPVEISLTFAGSGCDVIVCASLRNISERIAATQEREQLDFVIDNALDAIYIFDDERNIIYANEAAAPQTGYSKDELRNMNVIALDPEFPQEIREQLRHDALLGKQVVFETTHLRKDGTRFPVEIAHSITRISGIDYACGFVRDITERKQTERTNEELRFVIDNAQDAVYIYSHDGSIRYANESASIETGFSREELLSMNIRDLDPEFAIDNEETSWDKALLRPRVTHTSMHYRNDGSKYPAEVTYASTEYEGFAYSGAFVRNITERVAAESQMQMLSFAFDRALDLIYIHDERGKIIYANEAAARTTGYSRKEFTSRTVFEIAPSLNKDNWFDHFNDSWARSQKGHQQLLEDSHRRKDGGLFDVELSISYMEIAGTRYGFVSARDITQRKEAEEQMKLLSFAVEHALDSIRIYDESGAILYANEGACRATSYTREELTNLTVFDVAPDLSRETWRERMRTSIVLQEGGERRFSESANRRKDGSLFPTEVSVNYANFEGKLYGFSFVRDISQRKLAEQQMHMLSFAVENALDAIRIFDESGKIIYANKGACQLTGFTKEDFERLTIFDLAPELDPETWPKRLQSSYESQKEGKNR
jgi:PAS domain S-box-containing protein